MGDQAVSPITQAQVVETAEGKCEYDVVALYDDYGIPSIMHRFRKMSNAELFGGSEKIHSAFVIDGKEYDEIFISVYENCEINGRPYSLPHQKAWVDVTNDDFAKACFNKGKGWHMITGPEWGLLANISLKNGTMPHGNTRSGCYHADNSEHGEIYNSHYTLTGSGPATWTHDHTATGVHDLCGNHWEMVRGVRLKDGKLQAAKDNNAAVDVDLTVDGNGWADVLDNEGKPVFVHVKDSGEIIFNTSRENPDNEREGYTSARWKNVVIDCESEQMKELALFAGEEGAYLYVDATEGEWLFYRGGSWINGTDAGVFSSHLSNARSLTSASIGGRSAFYKAD
ncbi:MAG: hypothetical protein LUD12_13950 [Lachnospiraceae bacterium]|nr:hypothetical protein [Lachnospiraceae bacterium]